MASLDEKVAEKDKLRIQFMNYLARQISYDAVLTKDTNFDKFLDGFLKKLDENGKKIVIPLRIFLYFGEKIFLLESNSDYLRYAVCFCNSIQN